MRGLAPHILWKGAIYRALPSKKDFKDFDFNYLTFKEVQRQMQVSNEEYTENGHPDTDMAGIGKKMYYSISEVCAMTGIEPHILRYWEKEFSLLRPKKNSGGKRAYKEKDIEVIVKIKHLLEEEKYTLHDAKDKLLGERRERRVVGGNTTDMKRRKADAADDANGSESTDSTGAVAKPAKRKSVPKKKNTVRGVNNGAINNDNGNDHKGDNDNRGNDNALISGIRDELLGVLGLLERN
jgi:DNA-binding transcriptional MerR regulator